MDSIIYNFIHTHCNNLGKALGYGALEGFITYTGLITLGVLKGLEVKKHGKWINNYIGNLLHL